MLSTGFLPSYRIVVTKKIVSFALPHESPPLLQHLLTTPDAASRALRTSICTYNNALAMGVSKPIGCPVVLEICNSTPP